MWCKCSWMAALLSSLVWASSTLAQTTLGPKQPGKKPEKFILKKVDQPKSAIKSSSKPKLEKE
ncbi:MAG: hypothetical protein OXT67_10735, partial [Zetaproteobacteria bacterium]|nr:hypothetical protein [Zetaproteobacteria bacterium]